ncbi:uncharacterized protein LOC131621410 [Vicia villosa]|uniref:uncharacterized protein LOC131621410 n=1 Tax=Vicia villosa TaxID=3911 RepID=UPI00273C9922|nr:uncharacterized protein LOC131621410 [Vicia villosa]
MRIRKRQLPFSLSPVTFSDPNFINGSPEVVQLNDATTTSPKHSCIQALDHPQPSVQPVPPIGKPINGCDDSLTDERQHKKQPILVEDGRGQVGEEGQKVNDNRKGSISSAPISTELFASSSPSCSSYKKDWRWKDGEKAFPLKKRRESFATNSNRNTDNSNKDNNNTKKKMTMKMKNKMNNNRYDNNGDSDEEEVVVIRETKQKKVRGGALMEGSRCSRVNGRGWRCCQPTLVGYSLCEHHLGKGRLRSMASVRKRSLVAAKNNNVQDMSISQSIEMKTKFDGADNDDDDDDERKPLVITKKRMKLGMVKARSMSSLLGQTNIDLAIAENNK